MPIFSKAALIAWYASDQHHVLKRLQGFGELQQHNNMRHTKQSQGTPLVALMQTFFTKTLQFASAMAAKDVVESISQLDTLPSEDLVRPCR